MGPALVPALEAIFTALLVVTVFRLAGRVAVLRQIRFALSFAAFLLGVLLVENQLQHPGRDALFTSSLAVLVLVAVHVFLQVADHVVWERFLKPRHVPVPRLLFDIVNFVVLAGVGLALLKSLFAVNLTGLLVTSTVLSAILGLSLQDLLTSVMAGIALQLESPIALGDWIRVGEKEGEVVLMNWRTITLRSRDGHHVILPNSRVAKEDVVNFTRPTRLELIHVAVGVGYSHPPGEVKAVLAAAVAGCEGIAERPVQVLVSGFGDSAISYDVRVFTSDYARVPLVRDAVTTRIWYALDRAGFAIPFPQREVALRHVREDHEDLRAARMREETAAVLRGVETFRPLSDGQLATLARSARMERYTAGEQLVAQGEEGHSLFVIKSGQVRVVRRGEDRRELEIARLGAGSFFGEMSLLTGEPRSASVVAATELEVAVVDKKAFGAVIMADHQLVQALSDGLERRSRDLEKREAEGSRAAQAGADLDSDTLFARISRFFGLED